MSLGRFCDCGFTNAENEMTQVRFTQPCQNKLVKNCVFSLFPSGRGVNLTVVVGTQDITNKNNGIRIPVKFYHINPGYKLLVHNDIALLQVGNRISHSNEYCLFMMQYIEG